VIIRKSEAEIETMARAGRVVAETLALLEEHIQPGITTGELDSVAEEFIRSRGGEPTFKGYKGYPAATCLSPNDMVVHGIPGSSKLADGDILSVDVGVTLEGFVADSAWTFAVGSIAPEAQRLLDTCRAALEAGIQQAKVGNAVGDISQAVQTVTGSPLKLVYELRADAETEEVTAEALSDEDLVARVMAEFDAEELPPEPPEEGRN